MIYYPIAPNGQTKAADENRALVRRFNRKGDTEAAVRLSCLVGRSLRLYVRLKDGRALACAKGAGPGSAWRNPVNAKIPSGSLNDEWRRALQSATSTAKM
jgi:hypothetical protein